MVSHVCQLLSSLSDTLSPVNTAAVKCTVTLNKIMDSFDEDIITLLAFKLHNKKKKLARMCFRFPSVLFCFSFKKHSWDELVVSLPINWSLPEGCGGGGKDSDEKAGLSSRLVGAGDQQVVSGLQLSTEDHLSLVGVAVSRSTRRLV